MFEKDFNFFIAGKTNTQNHKERFCKVSIKLYGGKYKLLGQLTKRFSTNVNTFVDYFCGGGNVGVNVKANKVIAIDKNKF